MCPHSLKYVKLTEEIKVRIGAEKKPRFAEGEMFEVDYKEAQEMGKNVTLKCKDGSTLSID